MAKQPGDAKNISEEDRRFVQQHAEGLSDTATKYGRWINTPDEHEEHPGESLVTRSHDVIRRWAEERGARPATVAGSEHDDHAGVLRFVFQEGEAEGNLEPIDWDAWFEAFDRRELVFLFQEHTSDGSQSNFFQLDSPQRERA